MKNIKTITFCLLCSLAVRQQDAHAGIKESATGASDPGSIITNHPQQHRPAEALMATGKVRWKFKTKVPARITDAGQLYSTLKPEMDDLLDCFDYNTASEVIRLSREENWPKWFSEFKNRINSPKVIQGLKVYMVCELKSMYILFVPRKENGHIRKSVRPDRDFFMIFGKTGVELTRAYTSRFQPSAKPVTPPRNWNFSTKIPAAIVNPGNVYSTYVFKSNLPACFDSETAEAVKKLSNDNQWPEWVGNISNRLDNPDTMRKFRGYIVCEFDNYKIFWVPMKENGHFSPDKRPTHDFFMVFGEYGLKKPEENKTPVVQPAVETPKPQESAFARDLNNLIKAFPDGFTSIKGSKIEEAKGAFAGMTNPKFECSLPLDGAKKVYVVENATSHRLSITAEFKDFTDESEALAFYRQLQEKLKTHEPYPFVDSYFTHRKSDFEWVSEVMPMDSNNAGVYSGIIISLRTVNMAALVDGKIVTVYSTSISIYKG